MTDWTDQAACKGSTDVFYEPTATRTALAICATCPVRAECRADGDATETPSTTLGVRGGETESTRERRRWGRSRNRHVLRGRPRKPINHGTRGGAQAHRNRHEKPCPACLAADALYSRVRLEQRNGREPVHITHRRTA